MVRSKALMVSETISSVQSTESLINIQKVYIVIQKIWCMSDCYFSLFKTEAACCSNSKRKMFLG